MRSELTHPMEFWMAQDEEALVTEQARGEGWNYKLEDLLRIQCGINH